MSLHKTESKNTNGNDESVVIIFNFRISGNRKRDLDGMVSTLLDCMVKAGKIADDNISVVSKQITSYSKVKKSEEGVDIIIISE